MTKIRIENLDEARTVTVVSRSLSTGRDGPSVSVPAGQKATIDVDTDNQVSISTDATEGDPIQTIPPTAEIETGEEAEKGEEATDLKDATDEDVRTVLTTLEADASTERTNGGKLEMGPVNKALADLGFRPINAARRDELTAAPAAPAA